MRGKDVCSLLLLRSDFSLVGNALPVCRRYAYNGRTIRKYLYVKTESIIFGTGYEFNSSGSLLPEG